MKPNYNSVIPPTERAMTLLAHRVPLTLLADLLDPAGPASREIYRVEAVADDIRRELDSLAVPQAANGVSRAAAAARDM
jgi:hypothetical protein